VSDESNRIPQDLRYTPEHEWLRLEGEQARVGITDYAQHSLGDIVYVDLPKVGTSVSFMKKLGEIESVKVASELFSPANGEVIEVNEALNDAPELVNQDPYGKGWLVLLRLDRAAEANDLLDAAGYAARVRLEQGETA
jgi:glycine cleavage system H protein